MTERRLALYLDALAKLQAQHLAARAVGWTGGLCGPLSGRGSKIHLRQ